jgi:hypothetical protein
MIEPKHIRNIFVIGLILIFSSCGEGTLELDQTYEPKLVVQALIYPGQKVDGVYLTRNIPINTNPDPLSVVISNADVIITDMQTNKDYKLTFNFQKYSYEYIKGDWVIEYDRSYKLTIHGIVDGKTLSGYSITKTQKKGFSINRQQTISGTISYRELDEKGVVKPLLVNFNISEGTVFYPISLVALDANPDNFIYNNAYHEVALKDVIEKLDNFKYQQRQLQNINPEGKSIEYNLDWTPIWFYSRYRMIVYAGDDNFRQFSLTYRSVQEFDGNFHEPKINIYGEAIGVFASLIADTVYFNVKK